MRNASSSGWSPSRTPRRAWCIKLIIRSSARSWSAKAPWAVLPGRGVGVSDRDRTSWSFRSSLARLEGATRSQGDCCVRSARAELCRGDRLRPRYLFRAIAGFAVEGRSNAARSQSHCRCPRFIAVPDWLVFAKALDGTANAAGFNSCLRGEAMTKARFDRIAPRPIRRYRRESMS
jgi:hypothetical protein